MRAEALRVQGDSEEEKRSSLLGEKSRGNESFFFKIFRSLELESSFFSDPDGTISFLSPWHLLMCANRYLVCPGDSFS